jgi:hypothetical protein
MGVFVELGALPVLGMAADCGEVASDMQGLEHSSASQVA